MPTHLAHDGRASVRLFLVGITSTFKLPTVRYGLICVGAVLLLPATALILRQPGIPT